MKNVTGAIDCSGDAIDCNAEFFFFNSDGNLVTWSKKHNVMAQSSVEVELWAMAQDICELLWLKIRLGELMG